ncbi:DUF2147 domain-containing protein [Sinimarinibacterium sp. CAU 1509]|nr:DUF2147 domain-containing protein [Sinimarinibacterium sp. CAU 1509]
MMMMHRTVRHALLAGLLVLTACTAAAAEPAGSSDPLVGYWRAPAGDDSGRSSIVELFVRDGHLFGRIVRTEAADGSVLHPVCERCSEPLKGQPMQGMEFVRDLRKDGDAWVDGRVVDLRPGWTQGLTGICELRLVDGDHAELLGYRGLRAFGETSTWTREPAPAPSASAE